jgi:hypothetical protein
MRHDLGGEGGSMLPASPLTAPACAAQCALGVWQPLGHQSGHRRQLHNNNSDEKPWPVYNSLLNTGVVSVLSGKCAEAGGRLNVRLDDTLTVFWTCPHPVRGPDLVIKGNMSKRNMS